MKKRLGRIELKGGMYVQRSNWGFSDKLGIEIDDCGNIVYQCMIPAFNKEMFQDYMNPDGTIDMDSVPDDMKTILGVRIPTADRYYCAKLKVVGFTDRARGSEIILPSIFTVLNGADFDIDKMFVTRPDCKRAYDVDALKEQYDEDKSNISFAAYCKSKGVELWSKADTKGDELEALKAKLIQLATTMIGNGKMAKLSTRPADVTNHLMSSMRGDILGMYNMDTLREKVNILIETGQFDPGEKYKNGYTKDDDEELIKAVSGVDFTPNTSWKSRGWKKGSEQERGDTRGRVKAGDMHVAEHKLSFENLEWLKTQSGV